MQVLFLASEVDGLIKTGGLADVAKVLPVELQKKQVFFSPLFALALELHPQI